MLIVLSPAKTLDFTAPDIELQVTLPSMAKDTAKLAHGLLPPVAEIVAFG